MEYKQQLNAFSRNYKPDLYNSDVNTHISELKCQIKVKYSLLIRNISTKPKHWNQTFTRKKQMKEDYNVKKSKEKSY